MGRGIKAGVCFLSVGIICVMRADGSYKCIQFSANRLPDIITQVPFGSSLTQLQYK